MTSPVRSWPVRGGTPVAADQDEPRLVARVIGDVGGEDVEAVDLGGDPRRDRGRRRRRAPRRRVRAASAVEFGGPQLGLRHLVAQERVALRGGDRDREHDLHVGERRARPGHQAVLDVEHDLALDEQVVAERELVLGEVDGALDRVLDGDEPEVDLARLDGVEHVGHRPVQHVLAAARSGCDFNACSVNVPSGPRNPTRVGHHVSQAIVPLFYRAYTANREPTALRQSQAGHARSSWYGQSARLRQPHIELMSDERDPATISHPSQPVSSLAGHDPIAALCNPTGCERSPT